MLDLYEVARLTGARRVEIVSWIEEECVRPVREGDRWLFTEVDVARIRLILELRRDLRIGAEALPVVLSLLDRVNAMRRTLRTLAEGIAELPDAQRQALLERLAAGPGQGSRR